MMILLMTINLAMVLAGPATDPSYKDQYCTDPRTMNKHAAYTEWADAYSCTRHRCQPGGRNLAIYTVGCKRVEAPESAIECEEVVEDTNMQFPYCCTRLRCLVVVRGEVWTKVLGQPWETLPAAPWSHMYKMKKPPPGDTLLPKNTNEGPVYELTSDTEPDDHKQVLRASSKNAKDCPEGNEALPRAAIATPDIVIALSTTSEQKDHDKDFKKIDKSEKRSGRKRSKKTPVGNPYLDEETPEQRHEMDNEEAYTEKLPEGSEEKFFGNTYGVTQKEPSKNHQSWTEIPPAQWSEHDLDPDSSLLKAEEKEQSFHEQQEFHQEPEKEEKPSNLQALVDAIGTRMRDIENVVQKMSEKVHQAKPAEPELSAEKRILSEPEHSDLETFKHYKEPKEHSKEYKAKRPSADGDQYKRFSVRKSGSKYLHGATDITTEVPLFIEDKSMNGYFSDASNSVLRRGSANPPKEPPLTYMAPVDDNRRKAHILPAESEESDKKHKKHTHKKKHGKGKNHKKRKDDKRKRFNRLNSAEIDKNVVSLEDSSAVAKK